MYSMSLLMDFKVASDTEIGILKSIVGITKKIENNLRGGDTIAAGLLGSKTVDVGVLGGNTNDVGVPIPEVNALPQVLDANDVGAHGELITTVGKACGIGEQCGAKYEGFIGLHGSGFSKLLCDCSADGKSCHNLSTNNVLAFSTWANNFTSLTLIIFRVLLCVCD
jgi:hypothetical protein